MLRKCTIYMCGKLIKERQWHAEPSIMLTRSRAGTGAGVFYFASENCVVLKLCCSVAPLHHLSVAVLLLLWLLYFEVLSSVQCCYVSLLLFWLLLLCFPCCTFPYCSDSLSPVTLVPYTLSFYFTVILLPFPLLLPSALLPCHQLFSVASFRFSSTSSIQT